MSARRLAGIALLLAFLGFAIGQGPTVWTWATTEVIYLQVPETLSEVEDSARMTTPRYLMKCRYRRRAPALRRPSTPSVPALEILACWRLRDGTRTDRDPRVEPPCAPWIIAGVSFQEWWDDLPADRRLQR